jgi:hypothetical protein
MSFLRFTSLCAAGIVAAAAGPSLAGPAQAAPTAATLMQVGDAWLGGMSAWLDPYVALIKDQTAIVTDVETGARKVARGETPPAGVLPAWAAAQRARLADIDARAEALRGRAPPPLPPILARDLRWLGLNVGFTSTAAAIKDDAKTSGALARKVIDQIEAAAAGDQAARKTLDRSALELEVAALEGEDEILTGAAAGQPPNGPERDLAQAAMEVNMAGLNVRHLAIDQLDGRPANRAAVAVLVRRHADQVDASAAAMENDVRVYLAQIDKAPAGLNPIASRMRQALLTYNDSAANERLAAGVLRDMASALEASDLTLEAVLDAAARGLQPIHDRRRDLARTRQALAAD